MYLAISDHLEKYIIIIAFEYPPARIPCIFECYKVACKDVIIYVKRFFGIMCSVSIMFCSLLMYIVKNSAGFPIQKVILCMTLTAY